ncbi:MAG TPA: cupredoxin domain-containing protein [Symbiobacteriaceae bacterium]|jgi:uncharacterized cupredoxin-like copper-binding protein
MNRKRVVLCALLLIATAWLSGCTGAREPAGGMSRAVAAQVKQASVTAAVTALMQVGAKVNSGNTAAGREAYQAFSVAFGEVLAPVSFNDVSLAKQLSEANEALRDLLGNSHPDKAAVAHQTQVLAALLQQAGGGNLTTRAAAQLGSLVQNEQTITVKASEYKFEPAVIEVKKGTRVRIRLENVGNERHEFELDFFGIEIGPIRPGTSAEKTFVADRAGTYEYACHVDDHHEKGMLGFLKVTE